MKLLIESLKRQIPSFNSTDHLPLNEKVAVAKFFNLSSDGVLDMIGLYMSGIKNVVSMMGMYLYPEQAIELKKLGVEIIMWLHSNEAGWSHLYRNLHMLRNREVSTRGVWFTRSFSPREFVQLAGPERTLRWIEKARTFETLFNSSRPIEPIVEK